MARYNPVPGYPNCHYDTVGKTHVWHKVDAKGAWIGPGIGYSKNSCQDARCACMRAGNCGQLSGCSGGAPAHQTNQCPPGLSLIQYAQRGCKNPPQTGPPSLIGHAITGTPLAGVPGGGQPTGIKPSESCGGCNALDVGCAIGKQFCEFQGWLAKNLGQMAVPVAIGGGLVIILLLVKR